MNPEYFRNYTLDGWTVDWNNEIGFARQAFFASLPDSFGYQ